MTGERLVPVPARERELTESEVRAAFAAIQADNELWLAINQVLAAYIESAVSEVCASSNAKEHGTLAHAAGGIEWLRWLQADLAQRFRDSHVLTTAGMFHVEQELEGGPVIR
jgi:hypothetical protein